MPPSWVKQIQDHVGGSGNQVRVPSHLEEGDGSDWSGSLGPQGARGGGGGGGASHVQSFSEGLLSSLALPGEITAMAFEPVMGYLAVGTAAGTVHLYGSPPVQISWTLRPAVKVNFIFFKSGTPLIVVVDQKDNLSIYDISRQDPQASAKAHALSNPFQPSSTTSAEVILADTPMRISAFTARNKVMCVELSPAHSHLFLGLRDGTVDTYDLERLNPSQYRIPNLGFEEEEIARKSGVPGAPSRLHIPLITQIATHPKNVNHLLLAYERHVVLLDIKEKSVMATYSLTLLPGSVGSGADPSKIWTERNPAVTSISWRPDGEAFVVGHEDGLLSFWRTGDDEKPILVRSLDDVELDKPRADVEELRPLPVREPIFKLSWASFHGKSWSERASEAATAAGVAWQGGGAEDGSKPVHEDYLPPAGTVLTILGGSFIDQEAPGVNCLHFSPYNPALTGFWSAPQTPEAANRARKELRSSLDPIRESKLSTNSVVEDFILLPRDSPHLSMASDPFAILTLLAADPNLSPLPPPSAARGLSAYAFPPRPLPATSQTSDIVRSPSGRVSGQGGMPHLAAQVPPPPVKDSRPAPVKRLELPLPLTLAGSGSLLGARLEILSGQAYRKLTSKTLDEAGVSEASDRAAAAGAGTDLVQELPLRGGKAAATVVGSRDSPESVARSLKYKLLISWHLDGTIRFADASPHLLLVGRPANQGQAPLAESPNSFLDQSFPAPLPHLTISTHSMLRNPSMRGLALFDKFRTNPSRIKILDCQLAPEVLELGIVLSTGQVIHYRFGFARFSQTQMINEEVAQEVERDEVAAEEASLGSPLSARRSGSQHRSSMNELDNSMSNALSDLSMERGSIQTPSSATSSRFSGGSSVGPPPPRPRKDPKRLSRLSHIGSAASSNASPELNRSPSLQEQPSPFPASSHSLTGDHIIDVGHLASWVSDGFKPNCLIDLQRGEISAFSISDVGFLAVAHATSLAVVDLRGPEFLIKEGFGENQDGINSDNKEARRMAESESKSSIVKLDFSICRTAEDPSLALRLLVTREKFLTVWTLTRSLDIWLAERTSAREMSDLSSPLQNFVLDVAGNPVVPSPIELQKCFREHSRGPEYVPETVPDLNILLSVCSHTVALRYGLTGPKISRTEVGEPVIGGQVVVFNSDKVVVLTTLSSFRIFSLPRLEPITRLQRHNREHGERLGVNPMVSIDSSGDLIETSTTLDVKLWTVMASAPRGGPPALQLYTPSWMPPHPGGGVAGVASSISSWLGKSTYFTPGAALDALLAGPKRPPAPKLPEPRAPLAKASDVPSKAALSSVSNNGESSASSSKADAYAAVQARKDARAPRDTERLVAETENTRGVASRNIDAAKMRGEAMSNLENGLSNLEKGARDFYNSTRENMVKGAVKSKFSKFF